MPWIAAISAFLSGLGAATSAASKAVMVFLFSHLYLLIIPFLVVMKLIYDFVCETISMLESTMTGLGSGGGFHVTVGVLPSCVGFVNYFLPISETLQVASLIFVLWVGCISISYVMRLARLIRG